MLRTALRLLTASALAFHASEAAAYSWERPHSTSTNSGLFDATTIAATKPLKVIDNIGTFAPGASPVISADGTVFIGNEQGRLMTFRADGTPWWSRDVPGSIVASPLLDAAGNVYVVANHVFTDHRTNPPEQRLDASLHKFTVGGGWIRDTPLPGKYGASGTTAAPNMWKSGNAEVIILPIAYELYLHGGWETDVLAFSTDAQLLASTQVGVWTPTVTGGSDMEDWQVYMCLLPPFIACFLPSGFQSPPGEPSHPPVKQPTPTAAIFTYAGGGTPHILIADGFQNLVDYTFGGMNFNEVFRIHSEEEFGNMVATPTVTVDGHSIFTDHDGIRFGGPNMNPLKTVKGVHTLTAPTILRNGKVVIMTTDDNVVVLNGDQIDARIATNDFSIASAAASHNQFFLSTYHHFITYDTDTLQEVGRYDWADGGLSSPVIGPQGNVYVIEGNKLYVFPGPGQATTASTNNAGGGGTPVNTTSTGSDETQSTGQTTQSARQSYKPPLTADGSRLLACNSVDGDDCGKSDAKQVAQAFCEKQGFKSVKDIDTDTKKVQAQTLDGQTCTKKKCKVFSKIVCAM